MYTGGLDNSYGFELKSLVTRAEGEQVARVIALTETAKSERCSAVLTSPLLHPYHFSLNSMIG